MATSCPRCGEAFSASAASPAVSAGSLGHGTYHIACARAAWAEHAEAEAEHRAEVREVRSRVARERGFGRRARRLDHACDCATGAPRLYRVVRRGGSVVLCTFCEGCADLANCAWASDVVAIEDVAVS